MLVLEQYFACDTETGNTSERPRIQPQIGKPEKAQFMRNAADLVRKVTLFLDEPAFNRMRRHKILDRIAKLVRWAPWAPKQDGNGERFQSF
jgi:hypothetical protein